MRAFDLLWRGVIDRSDTEAYLRFSAPARIPGYTEIAQERTSGGLVDENVGRLHVAVNDAEYNSAVQFLWYGHRNVPKRSDYENSLKAIKVIPGADGELSVREQVRLLRKMCAIMTPPDVVDLVMKSGSAEAPADLLARIEVPPELRPGAAAWILYEALSVMISDGALTHNELAAARAGAASMGLGGEVVDALAQPCEDEEALRARRIKLLYSTLGSVFRFAHEDEGQIRGRTADLTEILAAARERAGLGPTQSEAP